MNHWARTARRPGGQHCGFGLGRLNLSRDTRHEKRAATGDRSRSGRFMARGQVRQEQAALSLSP
jgi:hypothetical protein